MSVTDGAELHARLLVDRHGVQNALAETANRIAVHRARIRFWNDVAEAVKRDAATTSREPRANAAEGRAEEGE